MQKVERVVRQNLSLKLVDVKLADAKRTIREVVLGFSRVQGGSEGFSSVKCEVLC